MGVRGGGERKREREREIEREREREIDRRKSDRKRKEGETANDMCLDRTKNCKYSPTVSREKSIKQI